MDWQAIRPGRGAHGVAAPSTMDTLEGDRFPCAFCKGSGEAPRTSAGCPVCAGHGSVSVAAPAVRCVYCRGEGEVPIRSGITCTVCRGKGAVSVTVPIEHCSACKGKGRSGSGGLPCTTCRGTGVVTADARRAGQERAEGSSA